jgi:hypothetical protein
MALSSTKYQFLWRVNNAVIKMSFLGDCITTISRTQQRLVLIVGGVFILSGFAALFYQVMWQPEDPRPADEVLTDLLPRDEYKLNNLLGPLRSPRTGAEWFDLQ